MAIVGVNPALKRLEQEAEETGQYDPLLMALRQQQTGQWSSDHRREANLLKGWNHIGITPICKMAASATVSIRDASAKGSGAEDTDRGAPLSQTHPLYNLVTNPNPWMTGGLYRWEVIQQMHLHGGAIVWRVRDKKGKTKYRIPIPFALTEPLLSARYEEAPRGGIRVRPIDDLGSERFAIDGMYGAMRFAFGRIISVDDLILYRYPHPFLRGDGHSPTFAGAAWVELCEAVDSARSKQMDRGPAPRMLVTPPAESNTSVDELDAYQKRLNDRVRNTDDQFVAVSVGSGTLASFTPEEMAYVESFEQLGPAIMALHGTSTAAAGLQDAMTYGSLAASMDAFNVIAVQPDLDIIADEDTATIAREYGENITIAYKAPEITNPEHEETKLLNDVQSGALTVGEYRIARGRKPHGDERDELPAGGEAIKHWRPKGSEPSGQTQTSSNPFASFLKGGGASPPAQAKSLRHALRDRNTEFGPVAYPSPYVVAIDLDGTLAEYDGNYVPGVIGPPRPGAVEAVQALSRAGCVVVIFTVRDEDAIVRQWCKQHGIPCDAVNENPLVDSNGGKVAADLYWDDRAVSADGPLTRSLTDLVGRIDNPQIRTSLVRELTGSSFSGDHGFLFIPIEGEVAARVRKLGSGIDSMIESENEPHVTLLYCVVAMDPEEVVKLLRPAATFHIRFGELAVFKATDSRPTDCLHLQVESRELDDLFQVAANHLPHLTTNESFTPHVTVGYLQPGAGRNHAGRGEGLTGTAYPVTKIIYRPPGGRDVVIPLRKTHSVDQPG